MGIAMLRWREIAEQIANMVYVGNLIYQSRIFFVIRDVVHCRKSFRNSDGKACNPGSRVLWGGKRAGSRVARFPDEFEDFGQIGFLDDAGGGIA
jgi:hypothetical protein